MFTIEKVNMITKLVFVLDSNMHINMFFGLIFEAIYDCS